MGEDAEVFFGVVVVEGAVGGFEGDEAGGAEAGAGETGKFSAEVWGEVIGGDESGGDAIIGGKNSFLIVLGDGGEIDNVGGGDGPSGEDEEFAIEDWGGIGSGDDGGGGIIGEGIEASGGVVGGGVGGAVA